MFDFRRTVFRLLVLLLIAVAVSPARAATFTDDEGQTVTFDRPFSRIISLYPAHTENLAYMGGDAALIGIGEADRYPESIAGKARFNYRDNAEKFLAAAPDLILIRPMISRAQPELIHKLRESGITVVSLQPTNFDQLFPYWQKLGQLSGRSAQADLMIQNFRKSLADLQAKVPADPEKRPRVYFEAIHSKMKTFDPAAISIFALTAGGGRNVASDASGRNNSNIAPYGKERLLSKGDSIDIFLSQVGRMNRVTLEEIASEPGFNLIKAVRTHCVYLIDEEEISRPTMRLLAGIARIQALLYPDLEKSQQQPAGH